MYSVCLHSADFYYFIICIVVNTATWNLFTIVIYKNFFFKLSLKNIQIQFAQNSSYLTDVKTKRRLKLV